MGLDLGVVCGCEWWRKKRKKRGSEKKSARKKKCGCYKCHSDYLSMMTQRFSKRSRSIRYGVATVFFLFVLRREIGWIVGLWIGLWKNGREELGEFMRTRLGCDEANIRTRCFFKLFHAFMLFLFRFRSVLAFVMQRSVVAVVGTCVTMGQK